MPRSRSANDESAQHWRQSGRRRQTRTGRRIKLLLLTVLGIALSALLARQMLDSWFTPRHYLVAVSVVGYDEILIPPIPFAEEDFSRIGEAVAGFRDPHQEPDARDRIALDKFWPRKGLRGILTANRDTQVFYLKAHGIAFNGNAYLLETPFKVIDFSTTGPREGMRPLVEILDQLGKCPAKTAVLILDVVHLPSDPRQGFVVNEFPKILQREVENFKPEESGRDTDFWVLAACKPHETCQVSAIHQQSVFGHFVAAGLRGRADENKDRWVDLDELAKYVTSGVSRWVWENSGRRRTQTPWLLKAGQPEHAPDKNLHLASCDEEALEDQGASEQEPAEAEAEKEEATAPQAAESEPGAAPEGPSADDQGRPKAGPNVLDPQWKYWDAHRRRTESWAPVDYAPHLWREFEAHLLSYDRRGRMGALQSQQDLQDALESIRSLRLELDDAGGQFDERDLKGYIERAYKDHPELKAALELKNDVFHQASYYVRWHARPELSNSDASRLHARIQALFAALERLVDELEAPRLKKWSDWEPFLDRLREPAADLEKASRAVDEEVASLAKGWAADARQEPEPPGLAESIHAMLDTPLLPIDQRRELLDVLEHLDPPAWESPPENADPPLPDPQGAWDRLQQQAELEIELVSLVDPSSAEDLQKTLGADDPWAKYRQFGESLGAFYAGLPERIRSPPAESGSRQFFAAERCLRAIDPRDEISASDSDKIRLFPVSPELLTKPRLTIAVDRQSLELVQATPKRFEVTVKATGRLTAESQVTLEFDPDLLEIKKLDSNGEVAESVGSGDPDSPEILGGTLTLQYEATPIKAAEHRWPKSLKAIVRLGNLEPREATIEFTVPKEEQIELVARAMGAVDEQPRESKLLAEKLLAEKSSDPRGWRLRPFPNRLTKYELVLKNHSHKDKNVKVRLLVLPWARLDWQDRYDERKLFDTSGGYGLGIKPLPQTTLTLKAGDEAGTPISPQPDPPGDQTDPQETAGGQAPAAGEASEQEDLAYGVACVIEEEARGPTRWIRWIDFKPLAPAKYLSVNVTVGDREDRRIDVNISAADADGDGQPDLAPFVGEDQPVHVHWDAEEVLDRGDLELAPGNNFSGRLTHRFDPTSDLEEIAVRLDVDGYPRAFLYQAVDPDQTIDDVPRADRNAIRINSPTEGQVFAVKEEVEAEDGIKKFRDTEFPVRLEVDATDDAFTDAGDWVKVGVDVNRSNGFDAEDVVRKWIEPRQTRVLSQRQLGDRGVLSVETKVSDFELRLPRNGHFRAEMLIIAQLNVTLGTRLRGTPEPKGVLVKLDGTPPVIEVVSGDLSFPKETPVVIELEITDQGGSNKVGTVQYRLNTGEWQPLPAPEAGQPWRVEPDAAALTPGRHNISVKVTDKVGNESSRTVAFAIRAEPKAPELGNIEGYVRFANRPVSGVEVRIKDNGADPVRTDADGRFVFRDLLPADYELVVAKGSAFTGKYVHGQATVTAPTTEALIQVEYGLEPP